LADVFFPQNVRLAGWNGWGFDYEKHFKAINPGNRLCPIGGFGQGGDMKKTGFMMT